MLLKLLRGLLRRAPPPADPIGELLRSNRPRDALEAARRRLGAEPGNALLLYQGGTAALLLGETAEAERLLLRAVELQPGSADARVALGAVLQRSRRPGQALEHYAAASRLQPDRADIHGYIGNMQLLLGLHQEAVASYRRALALNPDDDALGSNLLLALNSLPGMDRGELFDAHRAWGLRVESRQATRAPAEPRDPDPERPLRVGYVSADFRRHSVARFIEPVWARIDRRRYATLVYDNNPEEPDAVSQRLRGHADAWSRTAGLSDDELDTQIRSDTVDVLVDLSGHTAGNRLPLFARLPAPVQVSWFAYMNTTGLASMHYRLTDHLLAPPGNERYYTETLVRLPAAACWAPDPDSPPVNGLPSRSSGRTTFGSFNNWTKVSAEAISAWSAILSRLPGSRLMVVVHGGEDPARRGQVLQAFARCGIDASRLDILPTLPVDEFMRAFHAVDIALDTFPYTGGTTTLYSLWMGVPVVAMDNAGETGRGAVGLLRGVGIWDFLAPDRAGYIETAVRMAGDLARLESLRSSLRPLLMQSSVMQADEVTRSVEAAFRAMWRARLKGERLQAA